MKRLILTSLLVIVGFTQLADAKSRRKPSTVDIKTLLEFKIPKKLVTNAPLPVVKRTGMIIVAVIDTGIDPEMMEDNSICKSGHKDFVGNGLVDNHGHGTHISGIIDQYAKDFVFGPKTGYGDKLSKIKVNYCQIILKYYDPKITNTDNLANTIKALRWAIDHNVDIINYSGGGKDYDKREHDLIIEALDKGIKAVAAAGNESRNIDKAGYYPASYDSRTYVVGNLVDHSGEIAKSSNYGKSVNTWEIGTQVISRLPPKSFGYMTGTSQATAVKSGKLVREMLVNRAN